VLKLNDEEHLVEPRRKIGKALREELYKQFENAERLAANGLTPEEELKIAFALENLLKQGKANEPYSATVATTILNDPHYERIRTFMVKNMIWSYALQVLESELDMLRLDTKP
jgi:hypothetical protein